MSEPKVTVADLLREGQSALRSAGVDSPGLDAEILLRESLELSRESLFEALPHPVPGDAQSTFKQLIDQRCAGLPVAYITGRKEFFGHEFIVNSSVLVPRPETEYLVEWSLAWLNARGEIRRTVIDVGTGSGAIALSLALEASSEPVVIGSDVSREALNVAAQNRDRHGASVELVAGSLLDWCAGPVDLIIANLPYLRPDQAHPGIEHEPEVALFAGDDGFALNDRLLRQASSLLSRPGGLVMEIDPEQSRLALARAYGYFRGERVAVRQDLAGLDRYLIIERE